MFDPEGGSNRAGRQNPRKPSNDDPIILTSKPTEGTVRNHRRTFPRNDLRPPHHQQAEPSAQTVERQQDLHRRGAGARHRHRTVLRARAVRHRCHVVQPARLPKRDLDAAGHQGRPLAGVRGAHRRSRLHLRHAGDMGASRRCGRLHHPRERRHHRNRQERELQERSTHRRGHLPDCRTGVRLPVQRELVRNPAHVQLAKLRHQGSAVRHRQRLLRVRAARTETHHVRCLAVAARWHHLLHRHPRAYGRHPHHHAGERPWPVRITNAPAARSASG